MFTSACGQTATLGNFAQTITKTYPYLTPDLWRETVFTESPYQEHTDFLKKTHARSGVQKPAAPQY